MISLQLLHDSIITMSLQLRRPIINIKMSLLFLSNTFAISLETSYIFLLKLSISLSHKIRYYDTSLLISINYAVHSVAVEKGVVIVYMKLLFSIGA